MVISRNNTITVSLFSTLKRKKRKFYNQHLAFSKNPRKLIKMYPVYQIYTDYSFAPRFYQLTRKLQYMHQACLKQIYVYIYVCIIYHYALTNAKIELNERPSFTPSNWHWTSINTQFTDHVTAFRRRCLMIIRYLSISLLHACSVAESTGLATLPGLPLALTQDYITDVHTRAAGLQLGEVLVDSEVERGNGLTIVTEGTQLPISFWRFH